MNTDTRTVTIIITEEGKKDLTLGMKLDNHEERLIPQALQDLFRSALLEISGEEYRLEINKSGPDGLTL